jgi:hypothetical protein
VMVRLLYLMFVRPAGWIALRSFVGVEGRRTALRTAVTNVVAVIPGTGPTGPATSPPSRPPRHWYPATTGDAARPGSTDGSNSMAGS